MVAQSYCEDRFSMCGRVQEWQHSPTQRIKEVPDHSAPRSLSKGMPGVEEERLGRLCDALDVGCDTLERGAAHSSVGAARRTAGRRRSFAGGWRAAAQI